VLSTPPAFVLSQDQTLRECFVWLTGPSTTDRGAYGVIAGLDKLCARRVPKESATGSRSVDDRPQPPRTGLCLALTFGTLLSSQGADAHRYWTSRSVSGQLAKRYSVGFAVSNRRFASRTTRPLLLAAGNPQVRGVEPVLSGDLHRRRSGRGTR
jgi:hypothetical protein